MDKYATPKNAENYAKLRTPRVFTAIKPMFYCLAEGVDLPDGRVRWLHLDEELVMIDVFSCKNAPRCAICRRCVKDAARRREIALIERWRRGAHCGTMRFAQRGTVRNRIGNEAVMGWSLINAATETLWSLKWNFLKPERIREATVSVPYQSVNCNNVSVYCNWSDMFAYCHLTITVTTQCLFASHLTVLDYVHRYSMVYPIVKRHDFQRNVCVCVLAKLLHRVTVVLFLKSHSSKIPLTKTFD